MSGKRRREVTPQQVLQCFQHSGEVSKALDEVSSLLHVEERGESPTKREEREEVLLAPSLQARLSISSYWLFHLRGILSFTSFINGVTISDFLAMMLDLEVKAEKSETFAEVWNGIVSLLFREAGPPPTTSASVTSISHEQKCAYIFYLVCFPSADATLSNESNMIHAGKSGPFQLDFTGFILGYRDLSRLRRVFTLMIASHDSSRVELWQVVLIRSLFFCHFTMDPEDACKDCDNDDYLMPLNKLLGMFSPQVVENALDATLQTKDDETSAAVRALQLHSNYSSLLLLRLEYTCPFDRNCSFIVPTSVTTFSLLNFLISPPIPLSKPFIPHDTVLRSASAIVILGIREKHTQFVLRGFHLVALASSCTHINGEKNERSLLCKWLLGIIMGNSHVVFEEEDINQLEVFNYTNLSAKEFQFLSLTLCGTVSEFDEAILRDTCAVFRNPDVRALDPSHDAVDMLLQLCRTRLRLIQNISLQLDDNSIQHSGIKSNLFSMQSFASKSKDGHGASSSTKIPEVTAARVHSWAATFRRTGELPVSVSQLCHVLAQSVMKSGKHSTTTMGNMGNMSGGKGNIVLETKSFRLLFDCMKIMVQEEVLSTAHSSSASNVPTSSPKASLAQACQTVTMGMSKCSPPLCLSSDATEFSCLLDRITGASGDSSSSLVAGKDDFEPSSMKEKLYSAINYVLPKASAASPLPWQVKVTNCRKCVEDALYFPTSLLKALESLLSQLRESEGGNEGRFHDGNGELARIKSMSIAIDTTVGAKWFLVEFQAEIHQKWIKAYQESVHCCSSIHSDVLKRFFCSISLFVVQACEIIFSNICIIYASIQKYDDENEVTRSFVASCASAIVNLFRLAAILAESISVNDKILLKVVIAILRCGWRDNKGSVGDNPLEVNPSELGTNALFLLSLKEEARNSILHSFVTDILSCSSGGKVPDNPSCSIMMSLRQLVQMQCIREKCERVESLKGVDEPEVTDVSAISQHSFDEALAFSKYPQVLITYLFLQSIHSSTSPDRKFCWDNSNVLYCFLNQKVSSLSLHEFTCHDDRIVDNIPDSFRYLTAFLNSSESQRLFTWVYMCEYQCILGSMSRVEWSHFLSGLFLYLFYSKQKNMKGKLNDTRKSQCSARDSICKSFGDSIVQLIEESTKVYLNHDRATSSGYLSAADLNYIETTVKVLTHSLRRLSISTSLTELCSHWLDHVLTEVCGGGHCSDGKSGINTSPVAVSESLSPTPWVLNPADVTQSRRLHVLTACAWHIFQASGYCGISSSEMDKDKDGTTKYKKLRRVCEEKLGLKSVL